MTSRIKPGPGIGPTWKELIESGELRRILNLHEEHTQEQGMVERKPVFARISDTWEDFTQEEKDAWSHGILQAAKAATGDQSSCNAEAGFAVVSRRRPVPVELIE